jgi:hypothetical protein
MNRLSTNNKSDSFGIQMTDGTQIVSMRHHTIGERRLRQSYRIVQASGGEGPWRYLDKCRQRETLAHRTPQVNPPSGQVFDTEDAAIHTPKMQQ